MITDFVHTENTEENGGPQADGFVGKQQLSSIGQQLKEKIFFNCRYIAGNCCSRKRVGGLWSAIAINDQQLKENIYILMDTDGGPQADFVGKQQLSAIGQQLKEKYFF